MESREDIMTRRLSFPPTGKSTTTTLKQGRYSPLKKLLSFLICFMLLCPMGVAEQSEARLLYQGHGSLRIVTAEGKVIYIDPYAGKGYDLPADLILITHGHQDHTAVDLIKNRSDDCQIITYKEALVDGEYKTFDLGYAIVEAVQAGNNPNHDINVCVAGS